MKIIEHPKAPKPQDMLLTFNPMSVWLSKTVELRIEKGDTLADVTYAVGEHWRVDQERAAEIAAYWFAIGERVAAGTDRAWTRRELRPDPGRRYLRPIK